MKCDGSEPNHAGFAAHEQSSDERDLARQLLVPVSDFQAESDESHFDSCEATANTYAVEINGAIVVTQEANRRSAIINALNSLPDEIVFSDADTMMISCTRISA